jgi:hypothetical protein
MTTIAQYAHLSNAVYSKDEGTRVPGWRCAMLTSNEETGFQGGIYVSERECVLAFRGTADLGGVVSDVQLAVGGLPHQLEHARTLFKFSSRFSAGKRVSMCGHSLGGGLAQVIGYHQNLPFVTFNAPPMATNVDESWAKKARTFLTGATVPTGLSSVVYAGMSKVAQWVAGSKNLGAGIGLNLRLEWDVVSASFWGGAHVGRLVTLSFNGRPDEAHRMTTMISVIGGWPARGTDPFSE